MSVAKIIITAGGTGGHVFPGIAVAEVLQQQGVDVVWIGRTGSKEEQWVKAADVRFCGISAQALRGHGLLAWVALPWRQLSSVLEVKKILAKEKPRAILGLGGYVTAPVGLAAWLSRIPLAIHEQNAIAGMTNKWLAKVAKKVLCAVPVVGLAKAEVVGNPVRADINKVVKSDVDESGPVSILLIGGSQGAQFLNTKMVKLLAKVSQTCDVKIVHQTGEKQLSLTEENYQVSGHKCSGLSVVPFIDDMGEAYRQADLIICRAGALTVAEVAKAGLPAVFVPYPHAVDDHQTANAEVLVSAGAALMVQERDFIEELVEEQIINLIKDPAKRQDMAIKATKVMPADSAEKIAHHCLELMDH